MRLFLDANVLFTAAHRPEGKSAFVIELGSEGFWEVITCALAIEEARRNLEAKHPTAIPRFEKIQEQMILVPTIATGDSPLTVPEKDVPIFLSAFAAKTTHLLTGDRRHFGKYFGSPKRTSGIWIGTVSDFLESV